MKPLLSIIVPVYNVEKHISKCIDSVISQSAGSFELILLNDGSTDLSGDICNEYAEKDSRVIVKHTPNRGVSRTRNSGIETASGDWLYFLDSDDFLEENAVHNIMNMLDSDCRYDMLIGSFKYVYENRTVKAENRQTTDKGIHLMQDYGRFRIKTCIGAFVVKRKTVLRNHLKFDTNTKYGEDVEFINYCLLCSQLVKVSPYIFVNYNIHEGSAISKVTFDRYDCYKARLRTLERIKTIYPDYKELIHFYSDCLLPQAIIDTTYLLCKSGYTSSKVRRYLYEMDYDAVIRGAASNPDTPMEMRKKINRFIEFPVLTYMSCRLSSHYYVFRKTIGLAKRRILQ